MVLNCIAFVRTIVYDEMEEEYTILKGVLDMAKSANLYARIEPEVKEQA